jgi:hypothetical protein
LAVIIAVAVIVLLLGAIAAFVLIRRRRLRRRDAESAKAGTEANSPAQSMSPMARRGSRHEQDGAAAEPPARADVEMPSPMRRDPRSRLPLPRHAPAEALQLQASHNPKGILKEPTANHFPASDGSGDETTPTAQQEPARRARSLSFCAPKALVTVAGEDADAEADVDVEAAVRRAHEEAALQAMIGGAVPRGKDDVAGGESVQLDVGAAAVALRTTSPITATSPEASCDVPRFLQQSRNNPPPRKTPQPTPRGSRRNSGASRACTPTLQLQPEFGAVEWTASGSGTGSDDSD